jgi:hypothetical protein
MTQNLYISSIAPPSEALVKSTEYPVQIVPPDLVKGNKVDQMIYLVDGVGALDAISGSSSYTCKVAVGPKEGGSSWTTATFSAVTNGWSGTTDMTTAAVASAIAGMKSMRAILEVELTLIAGTKVRTIMQQEVTVLNRVIT